MNIAKRVFFTSCLIFTAVFAFAQEKSVESEYLDDVDGGIIMALADADDYDSKLVALQYLQSALEEGNTSDQVIKALDRLAGEGIMNPSMTKKRVMNNFPEIRRQACLLMAQVPTEHTKNTLISIAIADNEPMVIAAAVKSLGDIGINTNDEAVGAIAFANRRNQVLNPTSSLAWEVLNAFEILAPNTDNKKEMIDTITLISRDYHYVTPVRQKALKLLKQLTGKGSNSKNAK
ncbi:MAG: HEAT repeat domain-containing protein [Treponema sp.]|jgi:hypothetical protein|nr:HEAT repeat domain-containing protein [Treponema sp.]